jgi:hypothetical protein
MVIIKLVNIDRTKVNTYIFSTRDRTCVYTVAHNGLDRLRENAKHTLRFRHITEASLCSPAGLAADDGGEHVPDGSDDAAPLDDAPLAALVVHLKAPLVGAAAGRERAPVAAAGSAAHGRRLHGEHRRHGGGRGGVGRPGRGGRGTRLALRPPPEEGEDGGGAATLLGRPPSAALLVGGVVRRRRGERRECGGGGRVVLGRTRLRLPQERHRAGGRHGVVHPERRHGQLRRRLLGQHLRVELAPLLHEQPRLPDLLLAARSHGCPLCTLTGTHTLKQRGVDREEGAK